MKKRDSGSLEFALGNGVHIAVIGGGPAGAFFSIFALKMARRVDKEIHVTIYDHKDFTKDGPGGCNRCGGVVSELMVQNLAVEGINLPDTVVQRGIDSYLLHTTEGTVYIATPGHEKTIATVYRGGGPKGMVDEDVESFDQFLLDLAVKEGATHRPVRVDRVQYVDKRPVLYARDERLQDADLVVGAFGVNTKTAGIIEKMGFGYESPPTMITAIAEIRADREILSQYIGTSIQLYLLPIEEIKFAAIIPKGAYATLCVLGKNMDLKKLDDFLAHPVVAKTLPDRTEYEVCCRCLPKMNMGAPKIPFADRIVVCGDAGSTRLFKDGLGAAYLMGKSAAKTAVFEGVGRAHFQQHYHPVYKSIITDNLYGKYLYAIIDLYKKHRMLTKGMLAVVEEEQRDPADPKRLSSILWNMFTGNERFRNIFGTAVTLPMHRDLWREFARIAGRKAS